MRFSILGILAAGPLLAVALGKGCAISYLWPAGAKFDVFWDPKAEAICTEMGGSIANSEMALKDRGSNTNRCSICRGARNIDRTDDFNYIVIRGKQRLQYSVRCGWYEWGNCDLY